MSIKIGKSAGVNSYTLVKFKFGCLTSRSICNVRSWIIRVRAIQRLCRSLSARAPIDGVIGQQLVDSLKALDPERPIREVKFEARIKELVESLPDLAVLVEPLLVVRRVLREQLAILHRRLLAIVRDDEVCRRLMTVPGVGPVVALTYRATVDVPARFRKSKSVGAVFGLTCAKHQSGEVDWSGRISRCGDEMMRAMLYEAAQSMLLHSKKWSWLKVWAMQIARRRGMKKAIVALARRLAVILHRIWVDGTEFRWTREQAAAAA